VEAGAPTLTSDLAVDGDWLVKVSGRPSTAGVSPDLQAVLALGAGAVVALLLLLLLLLLIRSHHRALGMVEETTGRMHHQAMHDALTGLPNRVLAMDLGEQMFARARRGQLTMAALLIDLDGFKLINDTFGHQAGDACLRVVAERLRTVIGDGDAVARFAGDEFVLLLEETIIGVARGLRDCAGALIADADLAVNVAKRSGKNRFVLFESGMQAASQDRLTLEMDLAGAHERDELFLVYQPTFDLRTERTIGAEALLRRRHPIHGVIPPDRAIPIAEDSGQILEIGAWVLELSAASRSTR
jgi:predicted signal transduction protein with EAL and GGDEF domain